MPFGSDGPVCFQPSQIRFSCLPMSRVECMLKLPSLDLVFSSNRGELETPTGTNPTDGPHAPSSTPPGQHGPKPPPSRGRGAVLLGPAGFLTTIGTLLEMC